MDFIGTIIKGLVGIAALMIGVYLIANYGGAISAHALPLWLTPIAGAVFLANEPTRKSLAAIGLSGAVVIIVAGSSIIGWVLLLTIPPTVGYIVNVREFKKWDQEGSQ